MFFDAVCFGVDERNGLISTVNLLGLAGPPIIDLENVSFHKTNRSKQAINDRAIALVVAAIVLAAVVYFGFRMMRGLMMLGYVDSAIGRMKVLHGAETQFANEHPKRGYTCNLSELPQSSEVQRLLTGNGIDNGYAFEIAGCQAPSTGRRNSTYYTSAHPLHSGQPAFCSDQSEILKADYSGSVEECRWRGISITLIAGSA